MVVEQHAGSTDADTARGGNTQAHETLGTLAIWYWRSRYQTVSPLPLASSHRTHPRYDSVSIGAGVVATPAKQTIFSSNEESFRHTQGCLGAPAAGELPCHHPSCGASNRTSLPLGPSRAGSSLPENQLRARKGGQAARLASKSSLSTA